MRPETLLPKKDEKLVWIALTFLILGLSSNGLACFANGGRMPVLIDYQLFGETTKRVEMDLENNKWHQPYTNNTKFKGLVDRFVFVMNGEEIRVTIMSIGDIFLFLSMVIASVNLLLSFLPYIKFR